MSTSLSPHSKSSFSDSFRERVRGAVALKDYATSRGLNVPDYILDAINEAHSDSEDDKFPRGVSVRLDEAIRDLSKITYPTTAETWCFLQCKEGRFWASRPLNSDCLSSQ
jgi:hypothetical protein